MPSTIASALATLWIATSRLATYFMRLPLPIRAEVMHGARKAEKSRPQLRDRARITARIDHEILDLCLRAGAADRAIERDVAGTA